MLLVSVIEVAMSSHVLSILRISKWTLSVNERKKVGKRGKKKRNGSSKMNKRPKPKRDFFWHSFL